MATAAIGSGSPRNAKVIALIGPMPLRQPVSIAERIAA